MPSYSASLTCSIPSTATRIGIALRAQRKARTLAVARGEHKRAADEPKVWFTSMESLAQVLSTRNTLLLELIRRARPASLKELCGTLVPTVPYDRLTLERELG